MASSAKSELPDAGDKEPLDFEHSAPGERNGLQGPGLQDEEARTGPAPNKLDDVAGGDAKKKAQLALRKEGPYGEEVVGKGTE